MLPGHRIFCRVTRARIALLLAALGMLAGARAVAAQMPPRGERVRVTTQTLPLKRRVAEFRSYGSDSLFIGRAGQRDSIGFPKLVVTRFEVPNGERRRMVLGGALGLAAGAVAGIVIPQLLIGPTGDPNGCGNSYAPCGGPFAKGLAKGLLFVGFSAGGLVAGLKTAWDHPATRWRQAPLP